MSSDIVAKALQSLIREGRFLEGGEMAKSYTKLKIYYFCFPPPILSLNPALFTLSNFLQLLPSSKKYSNISNHKYRLHWKKKSHIPI